MSEDERSFFDADLPREENEDSYQTVVEPPRQTRRPQADKEPESFTDKLNDVMGIDPQNERDNPEVDLQNSSKPGRVNISNN